MRKWNFTISNWSCPIFSLVALLHKCVIYLETNNTIAIHLLMYLRDFSKCTTSNIFPSLNFICHSGMKASLFGPKDIVNMLRSRNWNGYMIIAVRRKLCQFLLVFLWHFSKDAPTSTPKFVMSNILLYFLHLFAWFMPFSSDVVQITSLQTWRSCKK